MKTTRGVARDPKKDHEGWMGILQRSEWNVTRKTIVRFHLILRTKNAIYLRRFIYKAYVANQSSN